VLDASRRGADLTRQLLSISKKQFIEQETVEINQSIKDLNKMMTRLVEEDISIRLDFSDTDIHIVADKGQLDQLLINLIVNARDAINDRNSREHRIISIKTGIFEVNDENFNNWFVSRTGSYMILEVADTGMGMDEETASRIFEPFFTTKDTDRGTGLGLATVYGIVKQHNGCIVVDSTQGEGTVFRILWPLATEIMESDSFSEESSELIGGKETILLVEDDPAVLESVSESLKMVGYRIIKAENAKEALKKMKTHAHVDLVMSDNKMPGMSGMELIHLLKDTYPGLKAILSSGYTDILPEAMKDEESGFTFIQKPYTIKEVIDTINGLFEN
jgi:two-component system cell cycle sensor histidine kinase/response regulator CckA